jgi:GNAT superfamily N-acetyltransferase
VTHYPIRAAWADFTATLESGFDKLASITGLDRPEIEARLDDGNRCYVGWLGGTAVAYGWVAGSSASIGELSMEFQLSAHDLYLWDFKTLPHWRGRGVYPRLLQYILRAEGAIDRRFWIITAPENPASANGIAKAGFRVAGDLAFARDGQPGIVPAAQLDAARTGASLLGVPLLREAAGGVSPCWSGAG